jgi:hypothetical protein
MRVRTAFLGLLAVGVAAPAAAQDPRLAGRLPDAEHGQIQALLDSARTAGVDVEPLVDRALEGLTKRAPADRIVAAVDRLLGELVTARDALGTRASMAELTAGAAALRAGARADDLRQLRTLRQDLTVTVAAGALADLVAAGVPADSATSAVLALATMADDAEYTTLRRDVERDVALGASPTAALAVRLTALRDAVRRSGEAAADQAGGRPLGTAPRKPKP